MKKTLFLLVLSLSVAVVSCKNSEEKTESTENDPKLVEQQADYPLYRGEFIFLEDGAVLKGSDFIYGVVIDEMSKALASQVAPVKQDEFDMVPVIVKGEVMKNPNLTKEGEAWEEVITIKEIMVVSDKPAKADIKIEETKE